MQIEHVALWCRDLDALRGFYETYFDARSGPLYVNEAKGFSSYFLRFASGARLELMTSTALAAPRSTAGPTPGPAPGYAHLAIATGSEDAVDTLTRQLAADGYRIADGPRRTGDGYYESTVLDPEGNTVEITV